MPPVADSARKLIFTLALTAISRYFLLRDRLLGRIAPGDPTNPSRYAVSRMAIPSGSNRLDGVLMMPAISPARAAVLICHGIGEVVDHWFAAQQLLADGGVASLVFDYSGYGRSTGLVGPNQCERDAIAAFSRLQELAAPLPVSILGFSLGTGISAAILPRVRLHKLVLCAAFTSFRAAAISGGFPRPLIFMSPQVWDTEAALTGCRVPVLIVHGEGDRLFPVQMARDLAAQCASPSSWSSSPNSLTTIPTTAPSDAIGTTSSTTSRGSGSAESDSNASSKSGEKNCHPDPEFAKGNDLRFPRYS